MKHILFSQLNLSKEQLKAIEDLGYEEATPIQTEAIPVIMSGNDVIGQAQTGTGKTAAFGIPALEMLPPVGKTVHTLILCPTRELALQVAEEISKLAKYKKNCSLLPIYGGQSIERQISALKKGVRIIIGTPGRIQDHIDRGTLNLGDVRLVVLDEADEMLNMGFRDDIEKILRSVPNKRQTVLFSATMPKPILELTKKFQRDPVHIKISHEVLTVPLTEQVYFEVRERDKVEALSRLIDFHGLKLSIVFCNTKRRVDELVEHLRARGYQSEGLHGDLSQSMREKVLGRFRKGTVEILVATDVAARGLDIDDVDSVFNYDMPQDEQAYVHRIGRTGRAGKTGKAFTFVSGSEYQQLKSIQRYINQKIKSGTIPSFDDIEELRVQALINNIKEFSRSKNAERFIHIVERLIDEEISSIDVAAFLMYEKISHIRNSESNKEDLVSNGALAVLAINLGRYDRIKPGDILGALAGESGLSGKVIGEISIQDKMTFIEIPVEYKEKIMRSMRGKKIKGKRISLEIVRQ